ncbi:MAG: AbrB family transcriptional regulator [Thermoprotei archaeon]|nr:MAG: AbrB family transcriptional regulator [Thermoprotei archaeon]
MVVLVEYIVKVTRKGRVTIPKELRDILDINIGDYLVARVEGHKVVFEKIAPPELGEPVGEKEYSNIIRELDEMRRK